MAKVHEKRAFLEAVWPCFLPTYLLPKDRFHHLLPSALLPRLPDEVNFTSVVTFLADDQTCEACFDKVIAMLRKDWDRLSAQAAAVVVDAVADNGLERFFDASPLKLNAARREFLRIRFDLADIIFGDLRAEIRQRLEELHVDLARKLITYDGLTNEARIVSLFADQVRLRGNVDLAAVSLAGALRSHLVIDAVQGRTNNEYLDRLEELREVLRNSTFFFTRDGEAFSAGDEAARRYESEIAESIEQRLRGFKGEAERFIAGIPGAVPPGTVFEECKRRMEGMTMSQPPSSVTNISFQGSNIAVLNTGTIGTINSIDQSIGALKKSGQASVADALAAITRRVAASGSSMNEGERTEVLEQVEHLGKLAANPDRGKSGGGVVKAIFRSLGVSLAAASLKDLWDTHAPAIKDFFRLDD